MRKLRRRQGQTAGRTGRPTAAAGTLCSAGSTRARSPAPERAPAPARSPRPATPAPQGCTSRKPTPTSTAPSTTGPTSRSATPPARRSRRRSSTPATATCRTRTSAAGGTTAAATASSAPRPQQLAHRRILGFQPLTPGSHCTCDCTTSEDNGAGLSWAITVPANGSTTLAFYSTFSPTGALADQPISATGTTVHAVEGKSFTGTVATFNDADTGATASEYSASINWGDGSTSSGTISGSGGNFTVTGTHAYHEQGSYTVKVTITDVDNVPNSATATSTATVSDAALHARSAAPSKNGLKVSGTLATFTDENPFAKASDNHVTIKWGDGHTSKGTVTLATGHFAVHGSHTYKRAGSYTITVTIVDDGGSTATVSRTVTLAVHGTARLSGVPAGCVRSAATLQVVGSRIASVTWSVDCRRIGGTTVRKGSRYSARISSSPGAHHVAANIRFVAASHTGARTLRATVSGCAAPAFTG